MCLVISNGGSTKLPGNLSNHMEKTGQSSEKIFGANQFLGGNVKTPSKIIVACIQKISNYAHP
jgi:hypothetical protein